MSTLEQEVFEALMLTVTVTAYGAIGYRNTNGDLHRMYGPAVIWPDGSKYWHWRGLNHRVGGPACIDETGAVQWKLFGDCFTEDEYRIECEKKTYADWKLYDADLRAAGL